MMVRSGAARTYLVSGTIAWGIAILTGLLILHSYESSEGKTGIALSSWPQNSLIKKIPGQPSLVMFAHPHCPCTRASLAALSKIMEHHAGELAVRVLFFEPTGADATWRTSENWHLAAAIPGVQVQPDVDGAEANRFGAETSGIVYLYDKAGRLQFTGGITGGRGRLGDNEGLEATIAILSGRHQSSPADFPVFGCPILDDSTRATKAAGGR